MLVSLEGLDLANGKAGDVDGDSDDICYQSVIRMIV